MPKGRLQAAAVCGVATLGDGVVVVRAAAGQPSHDESGAVEASGDLSALPDFARLFESTG
jgi:hypothetical protein